MSLRRILYVCLAHVAGGMLLLILGLGRVEPANETARARLRRAKVLAGAMAVMSVTAVVILWRISRRERADRARLERRIEAEKILRIADDNRERVTTSVNQLIEVFGETRDIDVVLEEAVKLVGAILHVDNIAFELYGSEESTFRAHVVKPPALDVDLGEELYEEVMGRGRGRFINGLDSLPEFERLTAQGFRSLLVTPLFSNRPGGAKEPIGFVAVFSGKDRDFTEQELLLLSTFARQASMIIENAHLYRKTEHMAVHDGLTNLYNHRRFREVLEEHLVEARGKKSTLGLIMGDIDHFKNFNDTHGHLQGDMLLRTVGDILRTTVRGADTVARYGGDEFVLLLDTDLHGSKLVCENIRAQIEKRPFPGEELQPAGKLTITFGLAMYPADGQDAESLIEAADRAMYAGKRLGRNRLVTAAEIAGAQRVSRSTVP